jgi:hypothetical protein
MADGLLNKASIILTPTGYKAGTLYNVAPIDEPYEDFDFARTSTATRINSSGLVSNVATGVPRINYDSNGANGHILLEPTSTNFLPYSNDFSQSNWVKQTNITPTYNTTETLSPDGTYNATKLVGNGTDGIYDSSLSITGDVTRSVYLKSVSGTINVKLKDSNVDIGTETLTVTTEWQRFYLSGDNGTSSQGIWIDDIPLSGIYIFGAQVEALPYATSYIPTLTGSTVTRATETANGAGSADLINSTEGVLYAEIAALADDGTNRCIALSDGTADDRVTLVLANDSNKIRAIVKSNGSTSFDEEYTVTSTLDYHKVAIKYKANDFALWIDGVERFTDTSGSAPIGLNELAFDTGISILNFYGKCKALAVFNEALSDDELHNLTG